MKLGIISDTHDNAANLLKAIKLFNEQKVELVIHCGDWVSPFMPDFCQELNCKIISIFGNNENDTYRFLARAKERAWNIDFQKETVELNLDGKKIIAYHGESPQLLQALISCNKYDAVFSGHNHLAGIKTYNKTTHVNPGSICGIRESKLDDAITVAIYDTKTNKAEILNLA
ncbi:MAG: metallophosphoesterase [Patescibacteria group bacterium]|nr:metallophosphoesterase [Patescibacteria group bacterium]